MTSLNISYKRDYWPISRRQFLSLAEQFHATLESHLKTPLHTEVQAFKSKDPLLDGLDTPRIKNTANSGRLSALTQDIWNNSGYVRVLLHPTYPDDAPESMFAIIETKGRQPLFVTYYAQCIGKGFEMATPPSLRQGVYPVEHTIQQSTMPL